MLRASIPATVEFNVRTTARSDTILADATGIQQVIMNLCTNAAYAMREKGGKLSIALVDVNIEPGLSQQEPPPGAYVELIVEDTGVGMSADVIKRAFDPFFTTKGAGQGTGMGLAVVYGIVKGLNGDITVESEPGKGSTFKVLLPKIGVDSVSERAQTSDTPGGSECILLVDDEESLVELGSARLERLGYRVTAMTNSEEAFKVFCENPSRFDLVITDQTMPGFTGLRLAEKILKARAHMPIILCTGHSDNVNPEKAKATGVREFLMKPLSKEELAQAVRRALDEKDSA